MLTLMRDVETIFYTHSLLELFPCWFRLASSYANFARSRTVTDGTCSFPGNVLGCDVGAYAGDVKYIADDAAIECSGKDDGKCASNISIPQRNQ